MSVVISDEVLQSAHISGDELLQELALMLYERGRLTLGQASQLAAVSQLQFQFLLASRHCCIWSALCKNRQAAPVHASVAA
jgi:predicted HTH domain antitoxin